MVGRPNVVIITPPRGKAATIPLSNLANILASFSNKLYIITGDEVEIVPRNVDKKYKVHTIDYRAPSNIFVKLLNHFYMQIRYSRRILKIARDIHICIFFLDGELLLLPLIVAKMLKKKTLLVLAASLIMTHQGSTAPKVIGSLTRISYNISDKLAIYSKRIIPYWNLEKLRDKILILREHLVDFDKFKVYQKIDERPSLVGFIGRLSPEKGIFNFLEAALIVSKSRDDISFLIGGDGPLRGKVESFLKVKQITDKVEFVGWIRHDELPEYLNRTKLLILPSVSEGLPNVLLEAMACGTPTAASPVGAIPSIIKDGINGFILESNAPNYIANSIISLIGRPELLRKTSENASSGVKKLFNQEKVMTKWRNAFKKLT